MTTNIPKDPHILVSYINMKLRDKYESLEAFCEDVEEDCSDIMDRLNSAGYRYDADRRQFRRS